MSMSQFATLQDYIDAKYVEDQALSKLKPTVEYKFDNAGYIEVGARASVFAVNHPRLGSQYVQTSLVVRYDKRTGVFETLNTIYVPYVEENTSTADEAVV